MCAKRKSEKRHAFGEGRYFSTCWKCGERYETDNPKEVKWNCKCGERLTWNDSKKLVTVRPWMLFKPNFKVIA